MKRFNLAIVCSTLVLIITSYLFAYEAADYPIKPVAFNNVKIQGGFWGSRLQTNRDITVWYDFKKCEDTGRIANFAVAGRLEMGGFKGIFYNDSDVYKVVEGTSYLLAQQPDEKLDKYLDGIIDKIAAAQEDDGYLYTARTINDPNYKYPGQEGRWSNLKSGHEFYNVGHLYEAAVAHYEATGKKTLLNVALKNADLVCRTFGSGEGQIIDVPGHEEIEIGLVKLYRTTGDKKYLEQAKFFIDMRGRADKRKILYGTYAQDDKPLVEQTEAVGHAVRGGYLYAGVADVAAITGDQDYIKAIDRIWEDVIKAKLYLTGNVGQFGAGEGYAGPYKLDNLKAYNETCAGIALALWNQRMFLLHGESKYIDAMERSIYNGILAGVSLSGDRFFYPNPLECDMQFKFNHDSFERSPWFDCSCCPTNVVRFLPSIAGNVYATDDDNLYVNLFVQSQGDVNTGGDKIELVQETDYPWDGHIKLTVKPQCKKKMSIRIRVPGWVTGEAIASDLYKYTDSTPANWSITVNSEEVKPVMVKGYAVIDRKWQSGDIVEINFDMPIRQVLANHEVESDRNRTAIERGPVVYCIEGADNNGKVSNIYLNGNPELRAEKKPELLGGITILKGKAKTLHKNANGQEISKSTNITMIPYYSWCHRGANEMKVWIPTKKELAKTETAQP